MDQQKSQQTKQAAIDSARISALVRAGMMKSSDLPRLKVAMRRHAQVGDIAKLPKQHRDVLTKYYDATSSAALGSQQAFQAVRRNIMQHNEIEGGEVINEAIAGFKDENNPPVMIVLQRKGIRIFPDGKKVAMYHNKQLGLVITIPYAGTGNSPGEIIPGANVQMEEVEQVELDEISRMMDKVIKKPSSDDVSADVARFLEKGGKITVYKPQKSKFKPGTALASKHDTTVARAAGGKGVPRNQIGKNIGLARAGLLNTMLTTSKKEKFAVEEVESVEESVATAQKVMDRATVVAKTNPDPKKRFAASGLAQKAMLRTINPTGVNTGIVRGGGNKTYRKVTGKVPPYQLTPKTGVSEEVEDIIESLDQVAAYAQEQTPKALAKHMKFADGSKLKVSHGAAKAIHMVHGALNDENKKKFAEMLKNPKGFEKAAHFALSKVEYKIGGK